MSLYSENTRAFRYFSLTIITVLIALISASHYFTSTHIPFLHEIYQRLYYLPIIFSGFLFGLRGALIVSLVISVVYIPHIVYQWGGTLFERMGQVMEIVIYNAVAGLTGFFVSRENKQREHLKELLVQVKKQSELLLTTEEQLKRADRLNALGVLSAGLAHEIRNPLGSIKGTAEIFRDKLEDSHPLHKFSTILVKESDRLNNVVSDFLAFAKGETATGEILPYNPRKTIDAILELLKQNRSLKKTNITSTKVIDQELNLRIPEDQLKQVVLNLLMNSIQASKVEGLVEITSSTKQMGEINYFNLEIKDYGSGIEKADLEKIFNPFFTTKNNGIGLGLSIVHRIIQGYGGTITVISEKNLGTTVSIKLPL